MKTALRLATAVAGVLGWLLVAGPAQAGVIVPVNTANRLAPVIGSPVTVSIIQGSADITDTWRPTWNPGSGGTIGGPTTPFTVFVVVNLNGVPTVPVTIQLVEPAPVTAASFTGTVNPFLNPNTGLATTSAYPGQCTNYGSPTDFTRDFDFSSAPVAVNTPAGPAMGFALTPRDCGGMAVLTVTVQGLAPVTIILPQDTNANGIPDNWENVFCPNNSCPTGREDNDGGPVTGSTVPSGDGIATFDEYRGFIVSGLHVSTDPRQKDLFLRLVAPQCNPNGLPSLLGGGFPAFPTIPNTDLFDGVRTLISGTQIHLLSYNPGVPSNAPSPEWVDNFVSYSDATGLVFNANGSTNDRQINANALYPIRDALTQLTIQKGLRVIECLDASVTSPLGVGGIGSPNGPDNAIIYTQRIVNYMNGMIDAGAGRVIKQFTYSYVNGVLNPVLQFTGAGSPQAYPNDVGRNQIISVSIMYYVAMEVAHSAQLTSQIEGTKQTSYGYHHAPGSGSNVDQAIINKVDKSAAGFNSFFVPSIYTSGDQGTFKLHN